MPSKQSDELKKLFQDFSAQRAANPEMPLDDLRRMFEHLGDVTGEPRAVDYIEVMLSGYRRFGRRQRGQSRTGRFSAPMAVVMLRVRCTRIARSTAISPRRLVAVH